MNQDKKLWERLQDSEDRFTERKSKGSTEEIRDTLVAFANSLQDGQEGMLFLGVSDSGDLLGVDDVDKRQKNIRRIAEEKCYPPIKVQLEVLKESGVEIVAVTVPFSRNKPHFAGPAWVRVGSENKRASQEMFEELITSRNDKGRYILQYREQNVIVDFRGSYHGVHNRVLCKVIDCTSHFARFREEPIGRIRSVSLNNISIRWEGEMNMPLISEEWN